MATNTVTINPAPNQYINSSEEASGVNLTGTYNSSKTGGLWVHFSGTNVWAEATTSGSTWKVTLTSAQLSTLTNGAAYTLTANLYYGTNHTNALETSASTSITVDTTAPSITGLTEFGFFDRLDKYHHRHDHRNRQRHRLRRSIGENLRQWGRRRNAEQRDIHLHRNQPFGRRPYLHRRGDG